MAQFLARSALMGVLLWSILAFVAAKSSKSAPAVVRKEDIKYIKCAVCTEIAKELSRQFDKKRSEAAPKQVSEFQIIELAENICNLKKFEGEWILYEDIVEQGDTLALVRQEEEGECKTECKTIEKACQEVIGYHDTDIAEFMYKGAVSVDELSNYLCKDLSKACRGKIPSVPKDRVPGEAFMVKSSKDAEIERIMKSMSDMPGAPGMKVYSKDDLMNGIPNFSGEDEDEDDDEEEDDMPQTKGKFQTKPADKYTSHSQSIIAAIKSRTQKALSTAQKHVKNASNRLQQWWSGASNSKNMESATAEL
ncbi:hypothetical protein GOP47_0017885 [Adiantum capillus-veneris]|uniref:DUF3456 domain-containing protein n=1 Tax=Adiantum capillus-veneris TaxID=13818 RepID=A0A9D4ZAZ9_ADICA|nr:hypothetical protein GOP47_0017885 [Adiantum capillus-veneris]